MGRLLFGNFEIRPDARQLLVEGKPAALGSRAFDVLIVLVERRDRVVSKDELIAAAWGGLVVEDNNLTVQISALRKLLGRDAITTVTGRGYRFTAVAPAQADTPASTVERRGNLPAVVAPLYGRDEDVRKVAGACAASPLVTLCGPGGIGKTSLAAVVANRAAPGFAEGAWIVELTALRDPAFALPAVARCLHIVLPGLAPAYEELASALEARSLLLVLDNCEHMLDVVARLADSIGRTAPGIRMLVTSQEPLRLASEYVYRLAPLAVPAPDEMDRAESFGAVRLFVERVRRHRGDFELTSEVLPDVVEICRQLEGIALAIELAAARVPLLGVAGVRARLGERLRLLTVGDRLAPRRHRTLRAALDWSYKLLRPDRQKVLRRLGVFTGGFSIEGAQLVVGDPEDEEMDLVEHLGVLVDRSLLILEPGRRPRYRMLESMREFALDRLEEAGESGEIRRRHAHAMKEICQRAVRERDSAWLWAEMNNARAGLAWAATHPGEGAVAVAIATHTAVALAMGGPVLEATNNLLRVKELLDEKTPPALEAQFWQWLGRFGMAGRLPTSQCIEALERAARMFEAQSNSRHVHACRRMLAEAHMRSGNLPVAYAELRAAAAVETAEGPPADRMRRLRVAGLLADASGNHADALRYARQALDIVEAHGIQRYWRILMADMAWVRLRMGKPDDAAEGLRALLRHIEATPGDGLTRPYALAGLTAALVAGGRLAEARASAAITISALRSSGIFLDHGDVFAWLAAASGHLVVAAECMGAAEKFHSRGETRRDRISEHARAETRRLLAAGMEPDAIAYWVAQGREVEEAVLASLLERACSSSGPSASEAASREE
jgi:predicted ATPase/DNA-binding winged helix-turn-helix (wHTH) protein